MSNDEQAFARWLEQQQVEAPLYQQPQWQQRQATAQWMKQQVADYREQEVPDWPRSRTFTRVHKRWWQGAGLSVFAACVSVLALLAIVLNVRVTIEPHRIQLSFAEPGLTEQQVNSLVQQRVATEITDFKQQQQAILTSYAENLFTKQQANNLQLTSYIMAETRRERKQDFSDFIAFTLEQRRDDNLLQSIKFRALAQSLTTKTANRATDAEISPAPWQFEQQH